MSDQQNKLIPFGKYKGQPLEAMAEDRQYTDWLVAQPWFRERYGNLYAVVINNFCEPSETPDHNALQARFLDDDFRLKFSSVAIPRLWWHARMDGEMIKTLVHKSVECKKTCEHRCLSLNKSEERINQKHRAVFSCKSFSNRDSPLITIHKPRFEESSVDCCFCVSGGVFFSAVVLRNGEEIGPYSHHGQAEFRTSILLTNRCDSIELGIEIKPEIGDDYPAILRQMRRNGSRYLFTRAYTGVGVDQTTFIQFMDSQGIRVIFEDEVDSVESMRIDNFDSNLFFKLVREASNPESFDINSV